MSTETDPMQDRPLRRELNVRESCMCDSTKRWHARALQLEVALSELLRTHDVRESDCGWLDFLAATDGYRAAISHARRLLEESP